MAPFSLAFAYCLVASIGRALAQFPTAYPPLPLPSGVSSSYVDTTNSSGLVFHYLSAGCDESNSKPLVLILHGFPEIAWGFKDLLVPIAEQGYCVVAPDQRGYGRTTGWDTRTWAYTDLSQWEFENLVRDLVIFTYAIGYDTVKSVMGHDFGTIPAGWAALTRPDMFQSVLHMSVPFVPPSPPSFDLASYQSPPTNLSVAQWEYSNLENALEHLHPPRKHYQWSNSESSAAEDYLFAPAIGGLHNFFRLKWFLKSYDCLRQYPPPHELASSSPQQLALIPYFYIMLANETFSETLATLDRGQNASVSKSWFPDSDIDVYVSEYQRTGFQGALNYYRALTSPPGTLTNGGLLWAGRQIPVPTFFLGGKYDWQTYIVYGALENYNKTSSDYRGGVLLPKSGHWLYIEQPKETIAHINKFLASL